MIKQQTTQKDPIPGSWEHCSFVEKIGTLIVGYFLLFMFVGFPLSLIPGMMGPVSTVLAILMMILMVWIPCIIMRQLGLSTGVVKPPPPPPPPPPSWTEDQTSKEDAEGAAAIWADIEAQYGECSDG